MKCSPVQIPIPNENCNNMNVVNNLNTPNRLSNSIVGIVGGPNLISDAGNLSNPSPIIQQQTTHQIKSDGDATSPTLNPANISATSAVSLVNKSSASSLGSTGSLIICGSCCQPICDRYIMKVVDTPYHERCLQCVSCCCDLVHSCFVKDAKLYCRIDYER